MPHPRHLVAAGVVILAPAGQLLMVQTFNRLGQGLILPGGMVEENEAPHQAAAREVDEELGLRLHSDRLLAVEHKASTHERPSSLQFVFAADRRLDMATALTLQPEEIADARWVDQAEAVALHGLAGQQRMAAALQALETGVPVYLAT